MCSEVKRDFILNAADEIIKYLDAKYGVEVDVYDIAGLINEQMGFLFDVIEDNLIGNEFDENCSK